MRTFSLFLFLACLLFSCNNAPKGDAETAEQTEENQEQITKKYILTPFTLSQAYPDARIESMDYQDGTFSFEVSGENYELGEQTPDAGTKMCANSAEGQHIHLIIDNAPYAAKYVAEFEHEVAEGDHYLLAFLSRSYHESIKTEEAPMEQTLKTQCCFTVGQKAIM